MRHRGFTLIEMLVVVAILVILAAVIVPVFSSAREKARQISCLHNVKQIATAAHLYTGDWDEAFPATRGVTGNPLTDPSLENHPEVVDTQSLLSKYLHHGGVWRCPNDESPLRDPSDPSGEIRTSYGINDWFEFGPSLTDVKSPSGVVYLAERSEDTGDSEDSEDSEDPTTGDGVRADAASIGGSSAFENVRWWRWGGMKAADRVRPLTPVVVQDAQAEISIDRHTNGANYGYADGHARWHRFADTWTPRNAWDPRD